MAAIWRARCGRLPIWPACNGCASWQEELRCACMLNDHQQKLKLRSVLLHILQVFSNFEL
jgi:hypothetical protein